MTDSYFVYLMFAFKSPKSTVLNVLEDYIFSRIKDLKVRWLLEAVPDFLEVWGLSIDLLGISVIFIPYSIVK